MDQLLQHPWFTPALIVAGLTAFVWPLAQQFRGVAVGAILRVKDALTPDPAAPVATSPLVAPPVPSDPDARDFCAFNRLVKRAEERGVDAAVDPLNTLLPLLFGPKLKGGPNDAHV